MPVSQLRKQRREGTVAKDCSTKSRQKTPKDDIMNEQRENLEELESQKLVRGLINAAIGCIAYLRGLVPEKSFCDISYEPNLASSGLGQEKCDLVSSKPIEKKPLESTRIKTIRRGISDEADTLLDWIEQGIFVALDKGYLQGFQLAIFQDLSRPDIIQEAYTFAISYPKGQNGKYVIVDGIEMTGVFRNGQSQPLHPGSYGIRDIKNSMKAMIRRLIMATQNLDLLPERRYLRIRLYHTNETPDHWAPPKFTTYPGMPFQFNTAGVSVLSDEVFGGVDTGLHSIQVRVTSLKRPIANIQGQGVTDTGGMASNKRQKLESSSTLASNCQIESGDEYNTTTKKHSLILGEVNDNDGLSNHLAGGTSETQPSEKLCQNHSIGTPDSGKQKTPPPTKPHTDIQSVSQASQATSQQHLNDREVKAVSEPPHSKRNRVLNRKKPNQINAKIPPKHTNIVVSENHNKASLTIMHSGNPIVSSDVSENIKMEICKGKLLELQKAKAEDTRLHPGRESQSNNDVITCDCGSKAEGLALIQCDICEKWQHCECYGFVGDKDPRIGDTHSCYKCLLGKADEGLGHVMTELALSRRLVRYLMASRAPKTLHDIAKTLDCQQSLVSVILNPWIKKGCFEVINPRGTATKKTPDKYSVVRNEVTLGLLEEGILNPLIHIGHHYRTSDPSITVLESHTTETN